MLKRLIVAAAVILSSAAAFATVQINATFTDQTGTSAPFAYLEVQIVGCGFNVPTVPTAGNIIVATDMKFTPSQLPATVYGNNEIACGNSYSTLYHVTAWANSSTKLAGDLNYDICSTTTNCLVVPDPSWNLAQSQPFTGAPPPPGYAAIFGNPVLSQVLTQPTGTSFNMFGVVTLNGSPVCTFALCSGGGGTGVQIYTNGTLNLTQTVLNIINGANASVVNTSGGIVSVSAVPSGSNTQIQYNCAAAFCGAPGFAYTSTGLVVINAYTTVGLQVGATSGVTPGAAGLQVYGSDTSSVTLAVNVLNPFSASLFSIADSGLFTDSYEDMVGLASSPGNPVAGKCRRYFNTTTGLETWINSSGGSCGPSGGGGGSVTGSGTANYLPVWTGSTALGNSVIQSQPTGAVLIGTGGSPIGTAIGVESFEQPTATCGGSNVVPLPTVGCSGFENKMTTSTQASTAVVSGFSSVYAQNSTSSPALTMAGYFSLQDAGGSAEDRGLYVESYAEGSGTNRGAYVLGYTNSLAGSHTVTLNQGIVVQTGVALGTTNTTDNTIEILAPLNSGTMTSHAGLKIDTQGVGSALVTGTDPVSIGGPTTFLNNVTFNITGASSQCLQVSTVGLTSGTGAPCGSLVIQTNGTSNASQSTLNFQTSTSNTVGLTATPVYHAGGVEQFEISGASYTGTAGTALALAALPTNCGAGSAAIGILANGNATGCFSPTGLSGLTQYGFLYAASTTTATTCGPGLIGQIPVSDGTSGPCTMAGAGVGQRAITSGGTDTILADSSTAIRDRGLVVVACNGSTLTETIPDAGGSGLGGNFVFALDVSDSIVSGTPCTASTTVTVNNTSASKFYIVNGLTTQTAQTSFTLTTGQWALINSPDNANWLVRISVPANLTTNSGGTNTYLAAFTSGTNIANATLHNVSLTLACNDTSGSATAQSCSSVGTPTIVANDELIYSTTTTNTGSLTTAVNGGSAITWKKWSSGSLVNLVANDIKASEPTVGLYDGTNLILQSPGNSSGGGGSPALSSVTASTGNASISNGANSETWQYLLTGASGLGFSIAESAASTGGTAGLQALLNITTLTTSTATPLSIIQGTISSNLPAANISTTWSGAGITGPALQINVTNTSSAATSCAQEIFAGGGGITLVECFSTNGFAYVAGGVEATTNTGPLEVSGGLGTESGASLAGGLLLKGSDNSNTGSGAKGGYNFVFAGGLTTSSPNASALEGLLELGEQGQKGTIAAVFDVVCSTATAFNYGDCSTTPANIVGIATTSTNPIGVVSYGQVPVKSDGTAVVGDVFCTSSTTGGQGHDNGSSPCAYPQVTIGTVISILGTVTYYTSGQNTNTQALSSTLPLIQLTWGSNQATFAGLNTTSTNGTNTNVTSWNVAPASALGGSTPLFSITGAASETDTGAALFVNTGTSSTQNPLVVQVQSVNLLQGCYQSASGAQADVVVGVIGCGSVNVSTFAKIIDEVTVAGHINLREWQSSTASLAYMNQFNNSTAAGTGWGFLQGYAGVSSTDTSSGGGTLEFALNGQGIFTTLAGITTVGLGVPISEGTLDQTGVSTANSGSAQNILASTPAAGHYRVHLYVDQSAGCATLGLGSLTVFVGWTDATHARVSATQTLTVATADTGTGDWVQIVQDMWAASGTAITVTDTYVACTTGTYTYDQHAFVEQVK